MLSVFPGSCFVPVADFVVYGLLRWGLRKTVLNVLYESYSTLTCSTPVGSTHYGVFSRRGPRIAACDSVTEYVALTMLRVLVAIDPRMYREVIAGAVRKHRPRAARC